MKAETISQLQRLALDETTTEHERAAARRALNAGLGVDQDDAPHSHATANLLAKPGGELVHGVRGDTSAPMDVWMRSMPPWQDFDDCPCPHERFVVDVGRRRYDSGCGWGSFDEFIIHGHPRECPYHISVRLSTTEEERAAWYQATKLTDFGRTDGFGQRAGEVQIWSYFDGRGGRSGHWRAGPWWQRFRHVAEREIAKQEAEAKAKLDAKARALCGAGDAAASMLSRYERSIRWPAQP